MQKVVLFVNEPCHLIPFLTLRIEFLLCSSFKKFQEVGYEDLKIQTLELNLPKRHLFSCKRDFIYREESFNFLS